MTSPIARAKNPGTLLRLLAILPAPVLVASSVLLLEFVDPETLLDRRLMLWIAYAAILTGWALLIGYVYAEDGPASIVIDSTNRMSLSLVQFGLWSLLLLATVPLALLMNLIVDVEEPWNIGIPHELLIASGVSLATLITAGFIEKDGEKTAPDPNLVRQADDQSEPSGIGSEDWNHRGVVLTRSDPRKAAFSDLVTGMAVNGSSRVDLARVQMLVLTLTIVGTYIVQLTQAIQEVTVATNGGVAMGFAFPSMSEELIALLALSSVGYLGGKKLDIHMSSAGR